MHRLRKSASIETNCSNYKENLRWMNWTKNDIPDCISALSVPQITAVHTTNARICWSTRGQGSFAGDNEEITAVCLMNMFTFRPNSAIHFLSALKEQERLAGTHGPPILVEPANPVPESPEMQRHCPAYTVRIPKQVIKSGKQAGLAAKKHLVLPPKRRFESSASKGNCDSDIDSDPEKSDNSDKSHKSSKRDKSSASEHTRDLPDLLIAPSLYWMWILIKLKNAGWRAFPAVATTEFTSGKWMVLVPVRRHSRQPGWSTYVMPRVRESNDWHSTGEYITAREVFSTRQEADGRVVQREALELAAVPVQDQPQQKPKQKKHAYGAG